MTTKEKYDAKFKDADILIIGDHPNAGTRCKFLEMIETDKHKTGLLMKVTDQECNVYHLKPENVFQILKP